MPSPDEVSIAFGRSSLRTSTLTSSAARVDSSVPIAIASAGDGAGVDGAYAEDEHVGAAHDAAWIVVVEQASQRRPVVAADALAGPGQLALEHATDDAPGGRRSAAAGDRAGTSAS